MNTISKMMRRRHIRMHHLILSILMFCRCSHRTNAATTGRHPPPTHCPSSILPSSAASTPARPKRSIANKGCATTTTTPPRRYYSPWNSRTAASGDTNDDVLWNVLRGGSASSSSSPRSSHGSHDGYYGEDGSGRNSYYGGRDPREEYGSSSYAPDGNAYDDDGRGYYRSRTGWYDDEGRFREDGHDDRGNSSHRRRRSSSPSSSSGIATSRPPSALFTGTNRQLGMLFLSSGAIVTILGVTLFFNKTLMRMGNLLFVAGVPLLIGTGRTVGYFLQPTKARATICLGCGIFLVLVGHPVFGILLEIFGLLNLFGNMFPLVVMMARNVPVLGGLFRSSGSNGNGGGSFGAGGRRERRRRDTADYDDGYYDERYDDDERYREDDYRY